MTPKLPRQTTIGLDGSDRLKSPRMRARRTRSLTHLSLVRKKLDSKLDLLSMAFGRTSFEMSAPAKSAEDESVLKGLSIPLPSQRYSIGAEKVFNAVWHIRKARVLVQNRNRERFRSFDHCLYDASL